MCLIVFRVIIRANLNLILKSYFVAVVSPLTRAIQTLYGAFPMARAPRHFTTSNILQDPKLPIAFNDKKRSDGAEAQSCSVYTTDNQLTDQSIPTLVWPVLAEHVTGSCDLGTATSSLQKKYPMLDFEPLPEIWWYTEYDEVNVKDLLSTHNIQIKDPQFSRYYYAEFGIFEPYEHFTARVDKFITMLQAMPQQNIACFGHSDFFNGVCERHFGKKNVWMKNAEVIAVQLDTLSHNKE